MALDITKLEKVRMQQGKIIARCPACAEIEQDKKGEHLFIDNEERFGCVIYPGETGKEHRKRIFALVGIKTTDTFIAVHRAVRKQANIIIPDILGRLGHLNITSHEKLEKYRTDNIQKDYQNGVLSVLEEDTNQGRLTLINLIAGEEANGL